MRRAQLRLSDAAVNDVIEQADWYEQQAGSRLSKRWERAVWSALIGIMQRPRSGMPCNFKVNELRNVRRKAVKGFPKHLVFYRIERDDLLVLRVIHGARDLEHLF